MKNITILGSTGSIGESTLDVVSQHPDAYNVIALTANASVDKMLMQVNRYKPDFVVMADEQAAERISTILLAKGCTEITVLSGVDGLQHVASLDAVDYVMAAIVGAAGLLPSLAAAKAGKRVLLANKEALVMSGHLFMQDIKRYGAELLPIDSEHNAIFQCMPHDLGSSLSLHGVERILLTASGGPFLNKSINELGAVTPDQACSHPNWSMGRKISVDSATMMNKGLEVIEAHWLFNAAPDKIQVVIHPQSVIHSMVQYRDGSVLAQMGNPDMRTPIAHAMAWPQRISSGVAELDLFDVAHLNFQRPDFNRFPCLRLAYEALKSGGTSCAILNAANEIAVESFLNETISFPMIPIVIESVLTELNSVDASSLEVILAADHSARELAKEAIASIR